MGKSGASSRGNSSSNFWVFRPKRIQSTILGPRIMFWVVSPHLVAASAPLRNRVLGCRFGTSSGQRNFFRDFLPKCFQSTTLGPKLMFWVVSHHLAAASAALPNRVLGCRFGTSLGWLNYCRVFWPKRIQTHVLGGFAPFGCCQCYFAKSGLGMPSWHELGLTKLLPSF